MERRTRSGGAVVIAISAAFTLTCSATAQAMNWSGWSEFPGNLVTDAPVAEAGGSLLAKGVDGRIFISSYNAADPDFSSNYLDWSEVPGGGRTDVALTGAVSYKFGEYPPNTPDSQLIVFGNGTEGGIYMNAVRYVDELNPTALWSGWGLVPNAGTTDTAFSAVRNTMTHDILVFTKGTGNSRVYVNRRFQDNNSWPGYQEVPGGLDTNVAVCATETESSDFPKETGDVSVRDQHTYLAAKGLDNLIYLNETANAEATTWRGWSAIPDGFGTNTSVSLTPAGTLNRWNLFPLLVVVAKGLDDKVYLDILNLDDNPLDFTAALWTGWHEVPGGFQTKHALLVTRATNGNGSAIVIYGVGLDGHIYANQGTF